MYFMPINGWVGGRGWANKTHMVSMETLSFDSKTWWEAGLGDGEGCLAALFSGCDGAVQVGDASCCDLLGREGGGEGSRKRVF